MTPPRIPPNAYTDAPELHPNLVVGSLHLLFWLIFRPSAWKNHIRRLDQSLHSDFFLFSLLDGQRWRRLQIWQFLTQGLLILPILTSLMTGLVYVGLGDLSLAAFVVVLGMALGVVFSVLFGWVLGVRFGLVAGVGFSVGIGLVLGIARTVMPMVNNVTGGIVLISVLIGVMVGAAIGVAIGIGFGMVFSTVFSVLFSALFALVFGMVGVIVGLGFGAGLGIGSWVNWWRPVLMAWFFIPWHFLLYRMDQLRAGRYPSLLHRHLAFWDEWQYLPIWGLEKHLLLVLEKSPIEGQAALNYLSTGRQRWAAQAAQIELDARQLEQCDDGRAISQIHHQLSVGELVGPADTLFRTFNRVSEDVEAALGQTSGYNQRLVLNAVADRLDALVRELTRSSDQYAARFRPIAQRWGTIIALELKELTQVAELRQEIDSPYIIGVPLTERQAIFVGRTEISQRIEQLLIDQRRPPLLLYGQRRTGKTSLLNHLGRLLPNRIIPLFVDLQGPASRASDHSGFLYNLARAMIDGAKRQRNLILPPLAREALTADPFTCFDEWLDQVEEALHDNTAFLLLDEFEVLDQALTEGRFNETAVLGMLRNLIQHHLHFKVLLAGSHTLEDFQRWSTYFINAQVLHLSYLKESETRQLIEHPVPEFTLRYEAEASQRVIDVTRGHPFLVQLLCAEIVALKNEQDPQIRRLATLADVEAAIPEALSSGSMFFSDLERNQVGAEALVVLRFLAAQGEGAAVAQGTFANQFGESWRGAIAHLSKLEVIESTSNGYRFQVELIRRWFAADRTGYE